MIYSQETIDRACTANRVMYWDLSRHTVRVEDAIESQEYEAFKDKHHAEEEKKFMTMHQEDNMEDSNYSATCHICGDPRGH